MWYKMLNHRDEIIPHWGPGRPAAVGPSRHPRHRGQTVCPTEPPPAAPLSPETTKGLGRRPKDSRKDRKPTSAILPVAAHFIHHPASRRQQDYSWSQQFTCEMCRCLLPSRLDVAGAQGHYHSPKSRDCWQGSWAELGYREAPLYCSEATNKKKKLERHGCDEGRVWIIQSRVAPACSIYQR